MGDSVTGQMTASSCTPAQHDAIANKQREITRRLGGGARVVVGTVTNELSYGSPGRVMEPASSNMGLQARVSMLPMPVPRCLQIMNADMRSHRSVEGRWTFCFMWHRRKFLFSKRRLDQTIVANGTPLANSTLGDIPQ